PLIPGEQEAGARGGTANVPAAAGLVEAARRALLDFAQASRVTALRDSFEQQIRASLPGASINGVASRRLPNTSSVTIPEIDAEEIVDRLALEGICIATGSACTAGATAPSHVLTAMGLSPAYARSTLRFSLSIDTTETDLELLFAVMSPLLKAQLPD